MISLNLFPKVGGSNFAILDLKNLKQGVDFIIFALENLQLAGGEGLSVAINERGNQKFPSVHFQQVGDRYFFQIYIGNETESIGDEGWYCLVEQRPKQSPECLISTIWDDPVDGFFRARFSDGLMLSTGLLVSENSLRKFLLNYTDNLHEWIEQGEWYNLGIV